MNETIENNINWLAQCQRRRYYPIDQSDRSGLSAFEYGWKSFNSLYAEFDVKYDKNKMYLCIDRYVDKVEFFEVHKEDINRFCDIDHKIYLEDGQYMNLNQKLSEQVCQLKGALQKENSELTIKHLIGCLYIIRNARVHGSFGTGKTRFSFLPKIIYLLNVYILSSKLGIQKEDVENMVELKMLEIRNEIGA